MLRVWRLCTCILLVSLYDCILKQRKYIYFKLSCNCHGRLKIYLLLEISLWLMWFFATVILSYIINSTVVVINLPYSLCPQNASVTWSILITVFYIPINPPFCLLHVRIGSSNQGVRQVLFKVIFCPF